MDNVTLERYWNNASLKAQIDAAARRERAQVLKRFLEQAAQALLGNQGDAEHTRAIPRAQPCEAC